MNDRNGKGFPLIDLMILVAATGMGLSDAVHGKLGKLLDLPSHGIFASMSQRNLAITVHPLGLSWTVNEPAA
jgi:hypothetical protein